MDYYRHLNLQKEPFADRAEPGFFYRSIAHHTALQRLELTIRLRRGFSLILGDTGTGKTTLSRMLLERFNHEEGCHFFLMSDPTYKTEFQFLLALVKMMGIAPGFRSTLDYKEALERFLFERGMEENQTIVLLIDEGHKLTPAFLEILRFLLTYETNGTKLLQLVMMARMEILPRLGKIGNLLDHLVLKYILNPLDEQETRELIQFRLRQAGLNSRDTLFTEEAFRLIYEHTLGYPRKIVELCRSALASIALQRREIVDKGIIMNSRLARSVF